MGSGLSMLVVFLFAVETGQQPLDARMPAGQRTDAVMLVAEEVFEARVSDVHDGDSVVIDDRGRKVTVRVDEVDAPELSQASGSNARAFLRSLLAGKVVTVRRRGRSHASGETVARLEVDGQDVSTALISNGLAWHCARFAENLELSRAQKDAQEGKRGLWQDADPTPPWTHRGADKCWEDSRPR